MVYSCVKTINGYINFCVAWNWSVENLFKEDYHYGPLITIL